MNIKRIFIAFGATFLVICCLFMVLKKSLVAGMLAGLAIGVLNFAAIVFTVKTLIRPEAGKTSTMATLAIYLGKLAAIGMTVAILIKYMKYFSIKGFLIGFTLTLLVILVEAGMSSLKKQEKTESI
ncbi:MAG: ATP synthase subunit I [Spirochaetia bacterium]|nr:ATP synthase subunit I [Spirochaetia bacterium]